MATKSQDFNPFSVLAYLGSDYFCDRENETKKLFEGLKNGRNITLISPRRMGKTGLIKHVFEKFDPKESLCFYVDLDQTTCLADLVQAFGKVVLKQIGMPSGRVGKRFCHGSSHYAPFSPPNPRRVRHKSASISSQRKRNPRWTRFSAGWKSQNCRVMWLSTSSKSSPTIPNRKWRPCCAVTYSILPMSTSFLLVARNT